MHWIKYTVLFSFFLNFSVSVMLALVLSICVGFMKKLHYELGYGGACCPYNEAGVNNED